MDLQNLSIFAAAEQNIKYQSQRQKVLAGNVANANTPDYLPKDVKRPSFGAELEKSRLAMVVTHENHMTGIQRKKQNGYEMYTPELTNALTIDGNGVVLEDQMNEISKSKSEHDRIIALYGKYQDMLNVANTKIGN